MSRSISLGILLLCRIATAGEAEPVAAGFDVSRTTVWLDRTRIVPFRVEPAGEEDRTLHASIGDPSIAELVCPPTILAGESIGYVRLRGRSQGTTRLELPGATLDVEVRPVSASARIHQPSLRILSPVSGAAVWGGFSVGVELTRGAGPDAAAPTSVWLELADGGRIEPSEGLPAVRTPGRQLFHFEVDARGFSGQTETLTAVGQRGERVMRSPTLSVRVVGSQEDAWLAGECEEYLDTDRPATYGENPPVVGAGPAASAGRFVVNERPDPAWLFRPEIRESGLYQMMVVARGDFGAGDFPSLGLCGEDRNAPLTTGRLVSDRWHRVALGVPVPLEVGQPALAVRYLNDIEVQNSSDRNLYLDRFELRRVDPGAVSHGAGSIGMMGDAAMMASSTMGGVEIAFERVFHRRPVHGRLTVRGLCRWQRTDHDPAPIVHLLVNGVAVQSQQAADPLFAVDRADLEAGENTIQLVAHGADGSRGATPEQVVLVHGGAGEGESVPVHRFSMLDERWNDRVAALLTSEGELPGHAYALLSPGEGAGFALPDSLQGAFDLLLEARGPDDDQAAGIDLSIETADGPLATSRASFRGWWNMHPAGQVELAQGPKRLELTSVEGNGTRLRAVLLRRVRQAPDRIPPGLEVLYPRDGHVAHDLDVVVVEAFDDDRIQDADVEIDGEPQRTHCWIPEHPGRLVLPLLLRSVAPGEHTLSVRVNDRAGNMARSRQIRFRVHDPAEPIALGPYQRAVRLAERFGYGPEPQVLAQILVDGERHWLEDSLRDQRIGDRVALENARTRMVDRYPHSVQRAALRNALSTDNPVRQRFVMWVENHFSTWIRKSQGPAEWSEHLSFQRLGAAPFAELLACSASSPAMLHYLDQVRSYAARLNENYAREIMELHTLGVDGGYDQADVTTLAGLLAGWTLADVAREDGGGRYLEREFRFDPDLGDDRTREILGYRFGSDQGADRLDRIHLALELLAAHPATARFVCRKIAEHYVSVPAPERLVEDLGRGFAESGGDLRQVLLQLAGHDAFWDPTLPARPASPIEFGIRLGRVTQSPEIEWALVGFLDRSGMALFDRATPDGYPEDPDAWADSNVLMQRWTLASNVHWITHRLVSSRQSRSPAGDELAWRQRVVDTIAARLTGRLLGDGSNDAALDYLATADGQPWERIGGTGAVIFRLPEAALR